MTRAWLKSIPLLLCGVLVLLAWPVRAAVVEQPAVVETGSVIVTAESAEVREGPSRKSAVITVVEKGEIFLKQGRTKGWYFIRINEDSFGWISGRAIARYQAESSPAPSVGPEAGGDTVYYPGWYSYDSRYYWGQPYLSWEWYVYDRDRHRDRSWDLERDGDRNRHQDNNRSRGDDWHSSKDRPLSDARLNDEDRRGGDGRDGKDGTFRRNDSHRDDDVGPRSNQAPRSSNPRFRAPFQRR